MKKGLFIIAALFTAGTLTAQQLPNNGFEDWHTFFASQAPDYWVGTNQMVIAGATPGIEPTTDAHSGTYAAKFSTLVLDLFGEEVLYPSVMYINSTPETDDEGCPFTGRPDSLVAWIKYLPGGQNQFLIRADLLKYNTTTQQVEEIASAGYVGTETGNSYTRISFPFTYNSSDTPDTLTLTIASSVIEPTLASTVLIVDDLLLVTNSVAEAQELDTKSVEFFPNPANDLLYVRSEKELSMIELVDLNGKIIRTVANPLPNNPLQLDELAAGTFICRVHTTDGFIHQERIIKQ
ncbi:MAG: T9SS type A sorting domain-containing protein [Fluviicola sp.]|nr:T9SS type A sorting domain-containing protein [Fluviicola sp.]